MKIKLRGWHNLEKKMILPPSAGSSIHGPYHINLIGLCYIQGKYQDINWMLWTGLKDKNDKEIYEGDVVQIVEHPNDERLMTKFKATIKFGEHKLDASDYEDYTVNAYGWYLDHFDIEKTKSSLDLGYTEINATNTPDCINGYFPYIEIIGNIYENPELLQNKESQNDGRS